MKNIIIALVIFLSFGRSVEANNWLEDFESAKKIALATDKLILVNFWASWCEPCEKMDLESWSKDDVKTLMDSYVSVQIDIDHNKNVASSYNVKGIPFIFILDGNGKVVYKSMSYMRKGQVMKLLKTYALSTEFLKTELINYNTKQNFVNAYSLATRYHDYSLFLDEDLRKDFTSTASYYFDEALSFLYESDHSSKAAIEQEIELYEIQKELILKNSKKALRLLSKIDKEDVVNMNTDFFVFLNYMAFKLSEDEVQAKLWEAEVKEIYMQRVELILKAV